MKNQWMKFALIAIAILMFGSFYSCNKDGFKKDKKGYYYKFYVENKDSLQAQEGDLVDILHTLRAKDSTFINNQNMQLIIRESLFEGDLFDVLKTMHKGDSATFKMNIDTFFHYFFGIDNYNPSEKNRDVFLDIKIINITPKVEFERLQKEQMEEQKARNEALRLAEDSLMKKYISDNKITVKPTESGLYFIQKVAGKGKKAEAGKLVTVHYTGKLLNGTIFDSSVQRDPFELVLGEGRVIPGWEEGIAMMKEGGKAQLLIPSALGYGEYGIGNDIPPFSPLVFDVELISVKEAPILDENPQNNF